MRVRIEFGLVSLRGRGRPRARARARVRIRVRVSGQWEGEVRARLTDAAVITPAETPSMASSI